MKIIGFLILSLFCSILTAQTPVTEWGFIGGRTGGWAISESDSGRISITGDTLQGWASIRGGFDTIIPTLDSGIVVTGTIEFDGSGFSTWSGLRFGLFYSDSAGEVIDSIPSNAFWNGTEDYHSGYLFIPPGDTNGDIIWAATGEQGTLGAVVNDVWLSTNGEDNYVLANFQEIYDRIATPGIYIFGARVRPKSDGKTEVIFFITNPGAITTYYCGGSIIDSHQPIVTTKFNSVCLAVNSNNPDMRGVHLRNVKAGLEWYYRYIPPKIYFVNDWGFIGGRTGDWSISTGDSGNVIVSGENPNTTWTTIRGGFKAMSPPLDSALVIHGKLELNGSGFDMPGYTSALRFGIFYSDSAGSLLYQGTDSACWSGTEGYHSGYLFLPPSGDPDSLGFYEWDWAWGSVNNSKWLSTVGNFLGFHEIYRWPAWAVATAGLYQFEIYVAPKEDGRSEIRYYLWNDLNCYKFSVQNYRAIVEPYQVPIEKFNCVCFGLASWEESRTTLLKLHDVNVSVEEYHGVIVPSIPCDYIFDWGFIGDRFGGWKISSDYMQNVTISGEEPLTSWAAIRGDFCSILLWPKGSISVTGEIEFVNGGFDAANSFRFGIFDSDEAACVIETPADSAHWYGTEDHHTGYLIVPPSSENDMLNWGDDKKGSVGAIVDDTWLMTENTNSYLLTSKWQNPINAVGREGKYNFGISVSFFEDSTREIRYKLVKADSSYIFSGKVIDTLKNEALGIFNCVAFALDSGNTTTMLKVNDIFVSMDTIDIPVHLDIVDELLPKKFELRQNYPNPFNPITQIEYSIPYVSKISLKVYNLLGQEVATLFEGQQKAGTHTVLFDGSGLASGVYYYRLETNDFTNTKKLLLLK